MAAPTKEERGLLVKFRKKIRDLLEDLDDYRQTDMWLLTWLRARELNLAQAEDMLRKSLDFNRAKDFDNAINWIPPEGLTREFPYKLCGFTEESSPVLLVWFGKWDVRGVVEAPGGEFIFFRFTQLFISQVQKLLRERSQLPQKVVTQFLVILDFEGYSYRQLMSKKAIKVSLELVKNFENNCPEMLRCAQVINAPKIFSILFALVKPLLTARTLSKVEIYGSNSSQWKPALLKNIPANQVPANYGGTGPNAFPDSNKINTNQSDKSDLCSEEDLTTLVVPTGKEARVDCEIRSVDSMLSWTYKTKDYDIGFRVVFEDNSEVYEYERLSVNTEPQQGMILCQHVGKYSLIFDNTFSRLRSKTIFYSVKQTPAVQEEINGNL